MDLLVDFTGGESRLIIAPGLKEANQILEPVLLQFDEVRSIISGVQVAKLGNLVVQV